MITGSVHIVSVGPHRAVAGLTWLALPHDDGGHLPTDVRMRLQQENATHGVVYRSPSGRWYVGCVPPGAPSEARRLPSAAVWLAMITTEPILYIEEIGTTHYWVLAVERGRVIPGTDQILREQEAGHCVDDVLSQGDRTYRIVVLGSRVPMSAMLERCAQVEKATFRDLILRYAPTSEVPPEAMVRQWRGVRPRTVAIVAIAAAVTMTGAVAWQWWQDHQRRLMEARLLEEARAREAHAQALASLRDVRIHEAVRDALRMDTATPEPLSWLAACWRAMMHASGIENTGWRIESASCERMGHQLLLTVRRHGGTFATLTSGLAALGHGLRPGWQVEQQSATVAIPLPAPAATARPAVERHELPSWESWITTWGTGLQHHEVGGVQVAIKQPQPKPITYIEPGLEQSQDPTRIRPVPPERGYRIGTWSAQGASLWALMTWRLQTRSLSVDRVQWTPANGDFGWRLEGTYVVAP